MRRVDYIEDLAKVHLHHLVRAAGGKKRLRLVGRWLVPVETPDGARQVMIEVTEKTMWRGGSRSFLRCPSCSARAMQLFWNVASDRFECRACWGPSALRYRSQEARRLRTTEADAIQQE
jgi:uncharacterized C2H2 Zn-finger protein